MSCFTDKSFPQEIVHRQVTFGIIKKSSSILGTVWAAIQKNLITAQTITSRKDISVLQIKFYIEENIIFVKSAQAAVSTAFETPG